MARHLAIFVGDAIEQILSGQKTIEARLNRHRLPPYGQIAKGDTILLKASGGLINGEVKVDNVLFYDGLDAEKIGVLRREYEGDLGIDESFWRQHSGARYASIIFLEIPKRYLTPIRFNKRDRRPWVVLKKENERFAA